MSLRKKIIVGITGSYGSGKSTIAKMFSGPDTAIIDADKLAHKVILPGSKIYKKIIRVFGRGILGRRVKKIDRGKLAKLVFSDKRLLLKLNCLVHPEVISSIKREIKDSKERVIILDAPLLIEAGLNKITDKLIVVKASRRKQIERICKKVSLNSKEALKRINMQMPLKDKLRLADFVVDNSGSLKKTKKQVGEIRRKIIKKQ